MKFLNRFLTSQEYDSEKESLSKPQVALVKDVRKVNYQKRILATSVELNKSTLSLSSGTSETLIATVLPTSASNKTLVWTSDNESVATVTSGGTVTAVGSNGNATITVKALYGGCSAQCAVQVEGSVVHVSSVSLNKNELTLDQGNSETLVATVLPVNASDKSVTWSTSNGSVATVNSSGVVSGISSGSAVITVTTVDGGYTAQCTATVTSYDPYVGHDYVEIGGRKWATMNIGANSVTDYGLYFQWGDSVGYTASQINNGQKRFEGTSYKYSKTSWPGYSDYTKYNSRDGKTVLDASDDTATINWGGKWRMPTFAEFQALTAATTSAWTSSYQGSGIAGLVLTDNTDSSKKLFFPANGSVFRSDFGGVGTSGGIFASTLYSSSPEYAGLAYYNDSKFAINSYSYRFGGRGVRAICDV